MLKLYRSLKYRELHHEAMVDGKKVFVDFIGGAIYPHKVMGFFTTADEKLQKALEEGPGFNTLYELEVTVDPDASKKQAQKPTEKKKTSKKEIVSDGPDDEKTVVEEVTNYQQARDYLAEKFEIKKQALANPKAIENAANKNNVAFPNME